MPEYSKRDILAAVKDRELQSEAVKDCAESVKESNPDMDKSTAFAICQDRENKGELSDLAFGADLAEDDPCWEGYVMVGQKTDENGNQVPNCVPEEDASPANLAEGCPEGEVRIGDECVTVEDVEAPPSVLNSSPRVHLASFDTEPIKREELEDGKVRYANLSLLSEGVWTDQASKTPTLYNSDAFDNIQAEYDDSRFDGPPVNEMHDVNAKTGEVNQTSLAGHVDPNSLSVAGDTLRGDVILDTTEMAGELADERMQDALESGGDVGYGGPSVELDLDRSKHIQQSAHPNAEMEITGGYLTGLGLVMNQADKNIGFDRETAKRAVAMGDGSQDVMVFSSKETGMPTVASVKAALSDAGFSVDDKSDDEIKQLAEAMLEEDMDEDEEEMEEEEMEDGEDMEDDEDEEEMEMQEGAIDSLEEQIDDLWGAVEEMKEEMIREDDMADANAELSELREEKENLEQRLSELEDEPKETKTLADQDDDSGFDWSNATSGVSHDSVSRRTTR